MKNIESKGHASSGMAARNSFENIFDRLQMLDSVSRDVGNGAKYAADRIFGRQDFAEAPLDPANPEIAPHDESIIALLNFFLDGIEAHLRCASSDIQRFSGI